MMMITKATNYTRFMWATLFLFFFFKDTQNDPKEMKKVTMTCKEGLLRLIFTSLFSTNVIVFV